MTDPEELDEDLFADLYEGDDLPSKPSQPTPVDIKTETAAPESAPQAPSAMKDEPSDTAHNGANGYVVKTEDGDTKMNGTGWDDGRTNDYAHVPVENDDNYGPIGIKEDGSYFRTFIYFARGEVFAVGTVGGRKESLSIAALATWAILLEYLVWFGLPRWAKTSETLARGGTKSPPSFNASKEPPRILHQSDLYGTVLLRIAIWYGIHCSEWQRGTMIMVDFKNEWMIQGLVEGERDMKRRSLERTGEHYARARLDERSGFSGWLVGEPRNRYRYSWKCVEQAQEK